MKGDVSYWMSTPIWLLFEWHAAAKEFYDEEKARKGGG
ncbi:hypothetical protein E6C60_3102 [Paenibacillus algicola]|uniref:Uncharacterized protein n=1 Tax=Paenibacillus algicola TaxID=2565926 RepID=A0A4P8XMZ6_9BACL|nr:hypothetical protein E6C60_3102 [Paenibacillus algicola]